MAYWQRKGKSKGVYVYTYSEGKHKPLARTLTKHLDGEPDHNIEHWVNNYELTHEKPRRDLRETLADKKLSELVEQYCTYMKGRGRVVATVNEHRRFLLGYVIPFFLGHSLLDPNQWPAKSFEMHDQFVKEGMTPYQISKSNTALRHFWRYLGKLRHLTTSYDLNLLSPIQQQNPTPLKSTLTPDQVLAFCYLCSDSELKLMALLGYFFSLRPQEVFALRKSDFVAGSRASALEPCKVMKKYNLFDKLAVNVTEQRRNNGESAYPKANSKGIVACFNADAARFIVDLLNEAPQDGLLFSSGLPDWMYVKWRRGGIERITLKDLRRASLYWLGHYGALDFTALRNHARHTLPETTVLYLRRPEEVFDDEFDQLDLEA